jgi:DNA adenine methylase
LCRFNARGFFNVPFGRYKQPPYREDFEPYRRVLANYEFTQGDFGRMKIRRSDFIYADPPYDVEFTSYSAGGFAWEDQKRLAQWLAEHPGPVVASNQATPRVLRLYRKLGFVIRVVDAPRRISCDGNRDDAKEMIAVRNL